jgi:hypothetical protein
MHTRRSARERRRASRGPAAIQEGRACCWVSATPSPLLRVLHVTPIGGVLPDTKGLQDRLHLLPQHGTLLIGLHGVKRVPYADGKAPVGIVDIVGQPSAPQARHRFVRHGGPIGLLVLLSTAGPQFPPGHPHNHDGSPCHCTAPAACEAVWNTPCLLVPRGAAPAARCPGSLLPSTRGRREPVTAPSD